MTTPDNDRHELRDRVTDILQAANTPLTVAPHDPADAIDLGVDEIGFYDQRFGTTTYLDEERIEKLLAERPARAVVEGLENLSAAYEISDAVEAGNPYSGGQTVSTFAQRFSDRALDQGLITLTAEGDQMSVDLPIADISGHPPERLAGQAVQAMENELDRITGTTVVERLEMDTPVGQQIDDGTLTLEGRDEQTHLGVSCGDGDGPRW